MVPAPSLESSNRLAPNAMSAPQEPDLTSWKEIAERLQVTVRTAQEWEKNRGLPVRRPPGGRGRVFMRVHEFEEWLDGDGHAGPALHEQRRSVSLRTLAVAVLTAVAAGALGVVAYGHYSAPQDRPVARGIPQWRVTPHELIVTGQDGQELWRAEFEDELNTRSFEDPDSGPRFIDLDGDGTWETLFLRRATEFSEPAPLICYDAEGGEMWRFVADADLATADESFENIFRATTFAPVRLSSGDMGIVVTSTHYAYYPTQIALLSATDGSLMAEYWHSGHIGHQPDTLLVADQDGDGRSEIYAAGISNARKRATLVVLDAESMTGASTEEDPSYQLAGLGDPDEIARILFPRTSMNVVLSDPYNFARNVWLTPEFINVQVVETIDDATVPSLYYHLTRDFTLDHVATSSTFEGVHARLLREGVLTLSLEDELAALGPLEYVGTPRTLAANR